MQLMAYRFRNEILRAIVTEIKSYHVKGAVA